MDKKIESFSEWFVIEPEKGQDVTDQGVYIGKKPENKTEAFAVKGTVICVPLGLTIRMDKHISIGDYVAVNWLDAVPVDIVGKKYLCVKLKDIMLRIEK